MDHTTKGVAAGANGRLPLLLDLSHCDEECRATPRNPPRRWGTAIGAWGDCLIAMGTFRHLVGQGGLLVWGQDYGIAEFAALQAFVEDVRHVPFPRDKEHLDRYFRVCDEFCEPDTQPWREVFHERSVPGVPPSRITPTHIDADLCARGEVFHWHGARLPLRAHHWADQVTNRIPDRFYVLHPFSLNSSGLDDHWPHWAVAVQFLLRYTPHTYVLTGRGWDCRVDHPRLLNLVNAAPDMMSVFALAERSAGVITTANSMSHYAVIQHLPAIVVGNAPLSNRESYFRRWLIAARNVYLVEFEDDLSSFIRAAARVV